MYRDASAFIYVFLPRGLSVEDREERYEEPLHEALGEASLGVVSGGGTGLGVPDEDGNREIEFSGVDVDADDEANVPAILELLRGMLPTLGCPRGTQLHYTLAEVPLQDEFDGSNWSLRQTRTMMHPGFGV